MVIARSIFVVRSQQMYCDIRVSRRNVAPFPAFFFWKKHIQLCFDINMLNKKTIILLNLAECA